MIIQLEGEKIVVESNTVVDVHYHGYFHGTDEVFDSSLEREPLTFLVGHGQMIPGFEAEILGAVVGEKRTFTLEPDRAYGPRQEEAVMQRSKAEFPENVDLEVGMRFQAEVGGMPTPVEITGIEGDVVTVDFNHPMAGKTLTFDIEIMSIRPAQDEEISHGHVHGHGGHHH
ncbi:TPA: peptidylprolyl isomerase [Candidatus Thalassarchaeaceae archaeon]|jgi:FKBP-type peptidyl-prolyl cis-trans isomerase SlyD|nr:peptidylprolyl isomerase [Euryarchaeota archaeon]MDG1547587.1 peptidylprolyl isomerase [Candidatus Thalassarchaeaceae archaeon]DAC62092.1 MAG TPA: peptidylprolyl isomerase [Candidatus Poseidoniales archaeon]MBT3846352.1 peptidylprolyl isomerase [Euryarchaeota archaeon]MBT4155865.1 peptidylprolyl isomerase [Euryarchaeota archaeon]|tara:strand:- start:8783 stop:9295 length:513 start_codon:yes stop_codon:yes gene_type:complete